MKKRTRGDRIFRTFLIPYLVILLIPLTISVINYTNTVRVVEDEVVKANRTLLQQSSQILNQRFSEIDMIVRQLQANSKVIQFQYVEDPFEGVTPSRILDTRLGLYDYSLSNNFLLEYFIFFKRSELAMRPNMTYRFSEFYDQYLSYAGQSYSQWTELFFSRYYDKHILPAAAITKGGKTYRVVTYIQSLGFPDHHNGSIVVLIDNDNIQKLLKGLNLSGGGWAYIANEHNQIISSVSSGTEAVTPIGLDGREPNGVLLPDASNGNRMITYITSDNGWKYVVAQPAAIVLEKVHYLKRDIYVVLALSLLAGIVTAYFMALRNSKPLKRIVNGIRERFGGDNESDQEQEKDAYRYIQNSFAALAANNEKLQADYKEQLPFLKAALFERMMRGELMNRQAMEAVSRHIGLQWNGSRFRVAIADLGGYGEEYHPVVLEKLDMMRVVVKEAIQLRLGGSGYLHDIEQDKIVLLFHGHVSDSLPANTGQTVKFIGSLLQSISDELDQQLQYKVVFGVGNEYDGVMNIARSFEEAKFALTYKMQRRPDTIIRYDELPVTSNSFYYPSDVEQRIIHLVMAGEKRETLRMLEELYAVNFKDRQLTLTMQQLFVYELWATIAKLLDHVAGGIQGAAMETSVVFRNHSVQEQFDALLEAYGLVCDAVKERLRSQHTELSADMTAHIQTAYMQPDLSLTTVSSRFGMSEVYLSQFFKEHVGINFSDYVEQIRMDHAKTMLAETELPIQQIAGRVGYNSLNTFCRAFKRLNGVSATSFRRTTARLSGSGTAGIKKS